MARAARCTGHSPATTATGHRPPAIGGDWRLALGAAGRSADGGARRGCGPCGRGDGGTGHNGRVLLAEVAEVSRAVAGAAGRLAKIAAIADALRDAGPDEVPIVVAYLSGELPQRQIGVGWAALRSAPTGSAAPSLTVLGVDASFSEIGAVV